jgi:RecA/RadA recombinase
MKKLRKIVKIEKEIKKSFSKKEMIKNPKVNTSLLVPTGSTTFNLECSGRIEGAFSLGKMVNIIGDSHAGKTLFALTIFAECSLLEKFDNYRFIYDDVESANEFDIEYLFGEKVEKRIEYAIKSRTIEDFNDNIATALLEDDPFIYVLDSFDALTSEAAIEKDADNRKAREKGNQIKGSYGDGKAKKASELFSQRIQDIADKKSLLIIISQTRDNIGFGSMFTPKTRSGGKALKFYASHEIWLACQKKEKSGKRTIVTNVQAKITKNKLTGRHGEAYFPILFDYGIDNISSCINFLVDEGNWTGSKKALDTKGFIPKKIVGKDEKNRSKAEVVRYIEDNDLENDLFELCQDCYDNIMEKLKPKRKRKY